MHTLACAHPLSFSFFFILPLPCFSSPSSAASLFCCLFLCFPSFPHRDSPNPAFFLVVVVVNPTTSAFHLHPPISPFPLSFPITRSFRNQIHASPSHLFPSFLPSLTKFQRPPLSPFLLTHFIALSLYLCLPVALPLPFHVPPLPPSSLSLAGSVSQRRDSRKERKGGKGRTRVRAQEWGRLGRGVWGLSPLSWGVGGVEIHPNILF
ncbi:hypothetical protein ATANTOWER_021633 [Ataeniobius toweri]|uniref:Uncharacterized protein n=1 Tax=Ataeniobius toweri TaxID=208326 RepID=A0ABU7B590_9TELE|nr:hypothetical protein [Ataeniobius toweri]